MDFKYHIAKNNGLTLDLITPVRTQKQPEWFRTLSVFQDGIKNTKDLLAQSWNRMFDTNITSFKTIKGCPGINNFFNYSMPINFPCQVFLETLSNGDYRWRSVEDFIEVTHHSFVQAPSLADKYIFMKFRLPIFYKLSAPTLVSYVDPILYSGRQPYNVSPGIINVTDINQIQELNVIAFFPREDAKYVFNPGQTLACIQFSSIVKRTVEEDFSEQLKSYRPQGTVENRRLV